MQDKMPIKPVIRWLLVLFIALLNLASFIVYAAEPFNTIVANQTLDKLTIKLSTQELIAKDLQDAVDVLSDLQNNAKKCVTDGETDLAAIKPLLPDQSTITEGVKLTTDQQFLFAKQTKIQENLAACRLFVLRSQDAITAFSEKAEELTTSKIFTRGSPVGDQIFNTPQLIKQAFNDFNQQILIKELNPKQYSSTQILILSSILLIVIAASFWFGRHIKAQIKSIGHENMPDKILKCSLAVYYKYRYIFPVLIIFLVFFGMFYSIDTTQKFLFFSSGILSIGCIIFMIIEFCFKPPNPAIAFCDISEEVGTRLARKVKMLASITIIGLLIYLIFKEQTVPEVLINISRDVFITIISISLFDILFVVNKAPKFLYRHKGLRSGVSLILGVLLTTIVIAQWLGYHAFSIYLLESISLTLFSSFVAWLANYLGQAILSSFGENKYEWQNTFHYYLGVQRNDTLPEIMGLKSAVFISVFASYLITLYNIWNVASPWARDITDVLNHQVTISTITFIPSRIILGFVVFSIFCLLTRLMRNIIRLKPTPPHRKASQEAMAAIAGYIGFFLAVLLGLIIAGVNVAGLALVAGALSVGIGFGLQGIVANFLAGIILLLERPIKPGDRINVGNEEGFVKKISIRATRITTLQQVDIIIPNAELISKNVVNYTFNNYKWRITLKVGVAYGSDIDLVRNCLLGVANDHPEVLTEGTDKPNVYFVEFSDSALLFELWCIIKDVNKKNIVLNELNSEVNKRFTQVGIKIPFPQRDIHIKDAPQPPTQNPPDTKPE